MFLEATFVLHKTSLKDVLCRSIMDDIIWKKRLDLTISGIKAK